MNTMLAMITTLYISETR